jgi:hypothetical protein
MVQVEGVKRTHFNFKILVVRIVGRVWQTTELAVRIVGLAQQTTLLAVGLVWEQNFF